MIKTVPDEPFKSGLEFLKAVLIGQGFWKNSGAVERVDTLLSMLAAAPASSEGQGTAGRMSDAGMPGEPHHNQLHREHAELNGGGK